MNFPLERRKAIIPSVVCQTKQCFPPSGQYFVVLSSVSLYAPLHGLSDRLNSMGQSSASQGLVTGCEWKATGEPEGRVSRLLSLLCCVSGPVGFYRPFIVCLTTIRSDKAQGNLQVYGLHHVCVVPFDSRMAYGEVWGLLRTPKTLILSSSAADMIGGCHCFSSVASDRMACSDRPKGHSELLLLEP